MAARSRVSRATAYRYFPSRSVLITAVIDRSLGPVRSFKSAPDGRERVRELFVQTFPRFKEFEPQMRAALQLALEHWALERAGLLEEETYRRATACASSSTPSHRWRRRCRRPCLPVASRAVGDLRHRAVGGAERHLGHSRSREVERIALWMADAMIDAALRDASGHATAPRAAPIAMIRLPRPHDQGLVRI